jgi:hypothetical protein
MKTKIKGWLMMDWNHIKPYPHPEHEFKAVTIYTDEEWMDEEGYNGVPVEIIVTEEGLKMIEEERAAQRKPA